MTKNKKGDSDESTMFAAYEKGEFKPIANMQSEIRKAQAGAARHMRKAARINIRLSESDMLMLKRKAAQEGMPYQTLIASVLHKFVSGNL